MWVGFWIIVFQPRSVGPWDELRRVPHRPSAEQQMIFLTRMQLTERQQAGRDGVVLGAALSRCFRGVLVTRPDPLDFAQPGMQSSKCQTMT